MIRFDQASVTYPGGVAAMKVRRRIVAGRPSPVEDELSPGARTLLLEPGR